MQSERVQSATLERTVPRSFTFASRGLLLRCGRRGFERCKNGLRGVALVQEQDGYLNSALMRIAEAVNAADPSMLPGDKENQ
jgi:hypothetical protein